MNNNYSSSTLVLRNLAPENVLENMLQLMRFSVYFERILKKKLLFSYRHNDISDTYARGRMFSRNFLKKWYNLVHFGVYFDQILSYKISKITIFLYAKIMIIAIHACYGVLSSW